MHRSFVVRGGTQTQLDHFNTFSIISIAFDEKKANSYPDIFVYRLYGFYWVLGGEAVSSTAVVIFSSLLYLYQF